MAGLTVVREEGVEAHGGFQSPWNHSRIVGAPAEQREAVYLLKLLEDHYDNHREDRRARDHHHKARLKRVAYRSVVAHDGCISGCIRGCIRGSLVAH